MNFPLRSAFFFALLGTAVATTALAAGPAAAKSFTITKVRVDATVLPNGDMQVTDTRTLDFSGTYHFVYWDLSTQGPAGFGEIGRAHV